MVMERMKDVNDNPRRRAMMLAREKLERDNRSYFNDAISQAEERVRAEAEQRLRKMARTLRDRGVDAAEICEITGWTAEEIGGL